MAKLLTGNYYFKENLFGNVILMVEHLVDSPTSNSLEPVYDKANMQDLINLKLDKTQTKKIENDGKN